MTWYDIGLEERAMRRTVYLPDDLAKHVDQYLRDHPGLTFSKLVQRLLYQRVAPRDISRLLELAGIVKEVKGGRPREQPEDEVARYDR
jgi:hypothetical protein